MAQENLDLVGSEEASGTCVETMAETHMIGAGADKMGFLVIACLTHLDEAIGVELECVVVSVGIPHVRHITDDLFALLEDVAVGEGDICRGRSPECTLTCMLVVLIVTSTRNLTHRVELVVVFGTP